MPRLTAVPSILAAAGLLVFALAPLGCGGSDCQPACETARGHGVAACVKGQCQYTCEAGYVDADQDWSAPGSPTAKSDGCELGCQPANGGVESCDGKDDDCNGVVDDVVPTVATPTFYWDDDGDGFGTAAGGPDDSVQACSAPDGYVANNDDCDDSDDAIHPGAAEQCDGKDDDCDGAVDSPPPPVMPTWYQDADGDGHGTADETAPNATVQACARPAGYAASHDDCDDGDPAVHPGAAERCDGVDDDCDGAIDSPAPADAPTWYADCDGDGYAASTTGAKTACHPPQTLSASCTDSAARWTLTAPVDADVDCDDASADAFPGQIAFFDTPLTSPPSGLGYDYDCDGAETPHYTITNAACPATGFCTLSSGWTGAQPACGQSAAWLDCTDTACQDLFGCVCVPQANTKSQGCR